MDMNNEFDYEELYLIKQALEHRVNILFKFNIENPYIQSHKNLINKCRRLIYQFESVVYNEEELENE